MNYFENYYGINIDKKIFALIKCSTFLFYSGLYCIVCKKAYLYHIS